MQRHYIPRTKSRSKPAPVFRRLCPQPHYSLPYRCEAEHYTSTVGVYITVAAAITFFA